MIYVLIFIGFLVVFTMVNKYNQSVVDSVTQQAQADSQMPDLAKLLGLQYQKLEQPQNKRTIMSMGERVYGTYNNIDIEMLMGMSAEHSKEINIGYRSAYNYSMQRTISFKVKNSDNHSFHIMKKSETTKGQSTGNADFDKHLTLTGDNILTGQFTDYLAKLGWMDLKLKDQGLVFNDNFMDQFSKPGFAGQKMLSAVHPIWKSSASHPQIDLNNVKVFIDQIIQFIQDAKLN